MAILWAYLKFLRQPGGTVVRFTTTSPLASSRVDTRVVIVLLSLLVVVVYFEHFGAEKTVEFFLA